MRLVLTGHERIDRRSIAMHAAIANKLRADPDLLAIAHANIGRWWNSAGGSRPYLAAWREILERPLPEIADLIVLDTERMRALRQNSPFAGVLTPRERWAIYGEFKQAEFMQAKS